MFFNVIGFFN